MDYVLIQTKPKLSPPSSGSSTDPYAGVDGSPNAAIGSAQWPNERANYAHPPAWKVSGWDYAVGINANLTMSNFGSTILFTYVAPPGLPSTHGLSAGQIITFYAQQDNISPTSGLPLTSTNVLPSALTQGVPYYVISTGLTETQFQVSTTSGGSAINASTSGMSGNNFYFLRDPFSSYTSNTVGTLVSILTAIGGTYPGSYSGNGQAIQFSGSSANNAVLWGYDFSLHTGIGIIVANCSGFTIRDNYWHEGGGGTTYGSGQITVPGIETVGSASLVASNVTVAYNIVDGGALQGYTNNNAGGIEGNGYGTNLIQYNWIKNFWNEDVVYGQDTPAQTGVTLTIQYNLVEVAGAGFPIDGSHGDWLQVFNISASNIQTITTNFNLWRQPGLTGTYAGAATQGLSIVSAAGNSGSATVVVTNNNTMVTLGTNTVSYDWYVDTSNIKTSMTYENNFVDPTGTDYGVFSVANEGEGTYNPTITYSGNTNLKTGTNLGG